jgi:hypothetical protein
VVLFCFSNNDGGLRSIFANCMIATDISTLLLEYSEGDRRWMYADGGANEVGLMTSVEEGDIDRSG